MKKAPQGFTLIELLIVIAIITILAAIAVPQYQSYAVKARISEALVTAGAYKTLVAENAQSGQPLNKNFSAPKVDTANVLATKIEISDTGVITIPTTPRAGDGNIVLTPQSGGAALAPASTSAGGSPPVAESITWACTSTIVEKYLPAGCING